MKVFQGGLVCQQFIDIDYADTNQREAARYLVTLRPQILNPRSPSPLQLPMAAYQFNPVLGNCLPLMAKYLRILPTRCIIVLPSHNYRNYIVFSAYPFFPY